MEILKNLASSLDLSTAKFSWKEMPTEHRDSADGKAVWALVSELIDIRVKHEKKYSRNLFDIMNNHEWHEANRPYIEAIKVALRKDIRNLFSESYSVINLAYLAECTGLDLNETKKYCLDSGWAIEGDFVKPIKLDHTEPQNVAIDNLKRLTEYALFLEEKSTNAV